MGLLPQGCGHANACPHIFILLFFYMIVEVYIYLYAQNRLFSIFRHKALMFLGVWGVMNG